MTQVKMFKEEVDKKYFTKELGFQCGKCKKNFSHQPNEKAVGRSRVVQLRRQKQDTSV